MIDREAPSQVPPELAAFRGGNEPAPLNARGITASLEVPGCVRRAVFDATGMPLDRFAPLLGCPPGEQAAHAFRRGNQFEARVMENNAAELIGLLRTRLGLAIEQVRVVDVSAEQVQSDHGVHRRHLNRLRVRLTRQHLVRMIAGAPGAPTLIRHAMTTLEVGDRTAYLEQDALAVVANGAVHVVEMKSFPQLDGRADPVKADAARRQSAVYALSLIEAMRALGLPEAAVSMNALLVIPENFSLNPVAHIVDLRRQVNRLRTQLARQPRDVDLVALLPEGAALPDLRALPESGAARAAAEAAVREVVSALPCQFGDGCMSCPAFAFCRAEAQRTDAVAQLGTAVVNACGSVPTVSSALALARGERPPEGEAERALAAALGRAAEVHDLELGA